MLVSKNRLCYANCAQIVDSGLEEKYVRPGMIDVREMENHQLKYN